MKWNNPTASSDSKVTISTAASSASTTQPPLKRFRLLSQDTFSRTPLNSSAVNNIDSEMQSSYVASNNVPEASGLMFWIDRKSSYPLMAPLAQNLLSSRAAQAYVERVFSVCGDLTCGKRNRLAKNLEKRTFLKMNKKYYDL